MNELTERQGDGWDLLNAESISRQHPASFLIPSFMERDALKSGDFAKVIFIFNIEGEGNSEERMWLKVNERILIGYVGTLDNVPTLISDNEIICRGSLVVFQPKHVIEVIKDSRQP